jgi:diaminohydroxyphosphoribosylaminopyrimidine deaminase/5-amino-6-(5-phosphoribosylamino)uracil reductase
MEITSLMVEGGSQVNAAVLASGLVDKVFLYFSQKVLGPGAVPFLAKGVVHHSGTPFAVQEFNVHAFGEDFAVEGYLADPYRA